MKQQAADQAAAGSPPVKRRRRFGYAVVLGLVGVFGTLFAFFAPIGEAAPSSATPAYGAPSAATVSAGRQLFLVSCASCHGLNAQGTAAAPSLIGAGAAAVDFQVGTGRMPAGTYQAAEEPQKLPKFGQNQINQLAAYIQSLAPGPQIPTNLDYQAANIALGGDLFRTNCASCHNAIGSGGELAFGAYAPSLDVATAKQIYEAMITGPENMPVFGDGVISPQGKLAIIKYLLTTRQEANPGGASLGRIGPVAEGLAGWIIGIGVLVGVTIWIGSRA